MENVLPEEFDSKVLGNHGRILALFYASWCPYCSHFRPTFEEITSDKIEKKTALVDEDETPL
jgi:thiol-disulfide isomerase/thioredoxin